MTRAVAVRLLPVCAGAAIGYLAGMAARDLLNAVCVMSRRGPVRSLAPAPRKAVQ